MTIGSYKDVKVEKVDDLTVRVVFAKPTPFWADAFVGTRGMLIPKHLFADYIGAKSRDAPTNLKPVGTGPYKFVDFKPGDIVKGEINPDYHVANRPHFDTIEMKGGGDAVSAARAVIQTGEYDYAWNMQVEDEILQRLEKGGKGIGRDHRPAATSSTSSSTSTDPWTEVDGERSSVKTKHPLLTDPAVRQALGMLVDRKSVEDHIYGRTGVATGNFLNNPERFRSKNTKWEFNVDKANQLLEAAGWKKGPDGIRAKDGKKLKFVYQTSINTPRQKTQAIVKQACQKAGIDVELKSVDGLGVLLLRRRQPGHLPEVLLRHPDVHDDHDAARSRGVHEPVHLVGGRHQGEQVAGPQHHALEQRGVRQDVPRGRGRARSGQARGAVHQA